MKMRTVWLEGWQHPKGYFYGNEKVDGAVGGALILG